MAFGRFPSWRTVFRKVHLWLGIGLTLLIVPISLTGLVLVFDDEIDVVLNPGLYATTGAAVARSADAYLRSASEAVGGQAAVLRWPHAEGGPVTVVVRLQPASAMEGRGPGVGGAANRSGRPGEPGGNRRPPSRLVYLDPPTAAVLGVKDLRNSLIGQIHVFHENLMVPEYSGRDIVGWTGVALLLLSVTGLILWFPRNGGFARALAWRRGPATSINLHHFAGFWISIPLGLMALTGIVLAFPPQASAVLNAFDAPRPPLRRPGGDPLMPQPMLTAERALALGTEAAAPETPRLLAVPSAVTKAWRLEVQAADGTRHAVSIDDATGQTTLEPAQRRGDAIGAWMRRVHQGRAHGPVWAALAGLCGALPTLLAITGVLMWLRKRRNRAALRNDATAFPDRRLISAENA
ncbi:MAG: PepSY domain-containing protein [Hyphomicrobiales bacterium]|jgi:uncharacterized iron-regulated membrane protein